jgi:hypothetical protein
MHLDWEVKNYEFNARECMYSWREIRLVALQSEIRECPGAEPGDLRVTFPDNGNAVKILEYFKKSHDNFRHGCVTGEAGTGTVHVFLAPVQAVLARR